MLPTPEEWPTWQATQEEIVEPPLLLKVFAGHTKAPAGAMHANELVEPTGDVQPAAQAVHKKEEEVGVKYVLAGQLHMLVAKLHG